MIGRIQEMLQEKADELQAIQNASHDLIERMRIRQNQEVGTLPKPLQVCVLY